MRLALSLRRTLTEMSEMSGTELALWFEFMRTEPIGHQREDINFALLKRQIAGLAGAKNTKVSDFLIDWGEPEQEEEPSLQTPEDFRAHFQKTLRGQ